MSQLRINQKIVVESNSSNTLLETMEQSGLEVEYQCREGHCGACRCKLAKGNVDYVGFAMAYTSGDEVLPCISRANGDVELEEVNVHLNVKRA
ncbi:class I ribonucleotide reductase maintenance protein YfaE [Vibrio sp. RC27]